MEWNFVLQVLETCCSYNTQCDKQKRSEINRKIDGKLDGNLRHCECEQKFRECLQKSSDDFIIADFRTEYFKHTSKCYAVEHPIIKCANFQRHTSWMKRCVQYELKYDAPKIYQTFDLALFTPYQYDKIVFE